MMLKKFIGFLAIVIVLFAACGDEHQNTSPVVASAGNKNLHLDELQKLIPEHPSLLLSSVQVQNFIQRWADEELVYQQAIAEDYDQKPDVGKMIDELIKNYVVASYLRDKVDNTVAITDAEINAYYEANSGEFIRPNDYYDVSIMMVETSTKANEMRQQILNGGLFEELVLENSLDASRDDGGKLGWVTLDQLPPEIANRVKNMSPNTISRPLKTVVGYYLVQLGQVRKKDQTQTLEESAELIRFRIKARKREESYRQLINQLKENSNMTINWSFIDSLNVIK